ncbi:MAG: hypothetical protein A3K19_28615 [Lentisphaerae bacterium RIFOXYB12_FULL_65_16]|nr:MAG: hypothetical protein A3K18_28365 [Lentisphaerae bacterium RIFOXYA12_64_32]OGV92743.1 MAG: hypothetical protein A3K19_28615 [Lentisphaerae bacterium RIFOXYB12_FULL_65_16]
MQHRRRPPQKIVRIFSSFEDENRAEHQRLREMTPAERWNELAVLQERAWGERWSKTPLKRVAVIETTTW